jgi:predicted  nucleic acid-binding Zn-ribbon protein
MTEHGIIDSYEGFKSDVSKMFDAVRKMQKNSSEYINGLEDDLRSLSNSVFEMENRVNSLKSIYDSNHNSMGLFDTNEFAQDSSTDEISALNEKLASFEKEIEKLNEVVEKEKKLKEEALRKAEELEQGINEDKQKYELLGNEYKSTLICLKELETRCAEQSEELSKLREENNHKTASVVMCSDATIEYAKLCVKVISIIHNSIYELDNTIRNFYQTDDDANFFYVRRRMNFMESTSCLEALCMYEPDIRHLAEHGCLFVSSEVGKAVNTNDKTELDSLKYFLYTVLLKNTIGATIILLKELCNMDKYTGVYNIPNIDNISTLLQELVSYSQRLGYEIIDVDLFKELPLVDEIECIEQTDVALDGLMSGGVYEIVKLAVNYGTYKEKTEVKIKI